MGIENIISRFSADANIVPADKKTIAKIGNPSISRICNIVGMNAEVFTSTGIKSGLSGKTKPEVLADSIMAYIPKFYSRAIGQEDVRGKASDVVHGFILDSLTGLKDKDPVVVINKKAKSGEVASTILIVGDKTITVSKTKEKAANYEETKGVLESINLLALNTDVFAEAQEDSSMLMALRSNIANSQEKSGPIFEALSCMMGTIRGIQRTPLAIQASTLGFKIDRHGEVFLTKTGTEFNVSQETGKIIEGTECEIAVSEESIDSQLITTLDGENVVKTGCAVQIGRDGSNYLSGGNVVLDYALGNFDCSARFIKPVKEAAPAVEGAVEGADAAAPTE